MTQATIERMLQYGGSFARAIAEAWIHADDKNRARLVTEFADLFARYEVNA